MDLKIPQDADESEKLREHIEEKDRHAEDRIRDEYHKMSDEEYREMKEEKLPVEGEIANEKKSERRQADETTAAMVDYANEALGDE